MLLRQMKYFAAVVDCNSFTEAAERCYISQSAISQQIQALEKELGVELLHRENRRFSLTPAGEYFYTHSKGVLEEIEDLRRGTAALGRDQEPRLRIGYLRCYSGEELHQAIAGFSRAYPEVPIHLVTGTHEELYDQLRFGGVDLILSDQRRAFSDEYCNEQLVRCGCYAELSTRSRLSGQEFVPLRDKNLHCCLGCELCQENGGTCVHRDDMPALLEKLVACDVLVLATPVYYYGFTAQMKTFLDRTFAKVGDIQNKDAYLLAAGASPEHSDMDALVAAYHGFLRCFANVNDKGIVYGVGAVGRGTVGEAALHEAHRLGKNL